jgi:2-phospho-L-lactate guanylyltransferase
VSHRVAPGRTGSHRVAPGRTGVARQRFATTYRGFMWHVIIPVKEWGLAKSRISLPSADRQALAEAMATDTIGAVVAASAVTRVVVVTTSPVMCSSPGLALADDVLVQPPGDLDGALQWAAQHSVPAEAAVAVLVADLPAVTPHAVDVALRAADLEVTTFVADRHGSGSTLLTAPSADTLRSSFGRDSARRHLELGATALPPSAVAPSLSCDVDTLDDLVAAERLGLGRCTSLVAQSLDATPGQ